jgi:hypothetical protein
MKKTSNLFRQLIVFITITAIPVIILLLDYRVQEIRKNHSCKPALLLAKDGEPLTVFCEEFLKLESIIELLFIVFVCGIISVIIFKIVSVRRTMHGVAHGILLDETGKPTHGNISMPSSHPDSNRSADRIFTNLFNRSVSGKILSYALLFIFGVIFWTPNIFTNNFFIWNDASVYLNLQRELETNYHMWFDYNLGTPFTGSTQLPLIVFEYILHSAGIPLITINHSFMLLSTVVAGWAMYYFLYNTIRTNRNTIAFSGASLYMLSPLVATYALGTIFAFSYSLFPLFFHFMYKGLDQKGNELKYACVIGVVTLGISLAIQFVALALIVAILLVMSILVTKRRINVKFLLYAFTLAFMINSFWILPVASNADFLSRVYDPDVTGHTILAESSSSDILRHLRLLSDEANAQFYNYDILGLLTWLIPPYCFAAVFLVKRRLVYFIALIAVLSLLFSTGAKYPVMDSIYGGITNSLPQLAILLQNITDYLFVTSFSYAVLFAFTTETLFTYLMRRPTNKAGKNNKGRSVVYVVIAILLIPNFYTVIFDVPNTSGLNKTIGMSIPQEYLLLPDIFYESDKYNGYRLLVLPWQNWYIEYSWYPASDVVDMVHRYSPLQTLGATNILGYDKSVAELKKQMIYVDKPNLDRLRDVFYDFGIKYVLVHKDFKNTPGLEGYSDVSNLNSNVGNEVYGYSYNSNLVVALGGTEFADNQYYTVYEMPSAKKVITPEEDFKRINPTLYSGGVRSDIPFDIVLNQNHNKNWLLTINGTQIEDKTLELTSLTKNGTWTKEGTGNEIITLSDRIIGISDVPAHTSKEQNFYKVTKIFEKPIDITGYDTILFIYKLDSKRDLVSSVRIYDDKNIFLEWPLKQYGGSGQYLIDAHPLDTFEFGEYKFNYKNMTRVSFDFANNEETAKPVLLEISDIILERNIHFVYNGYANAWRIENPGHYEFIIEYGTQWIMPFSTSLSVITVMFISVVLVRGTINNITRRH